MRKLLPIAVMLVMTATATATPILVGSATDPLGALNLQIGNTTYDAFFSTKSYDMLFPTAGPLVPFGGTPAAPAAGLLDAADGAIAATELATLFDSTSVTGLLGAACGMSASGQYNGFCDVFIPTGFSCGGLICSETVSDEAPFAPEGPGHWGVQGQDEFIPGPSTVLGAGCTSARQCFPREFAYFQPVRTVPEPDATFLIGAGLVLVGVALRTSKSRRTSG